MKNIRITYQSYILTLLISLSVISIPVLIVNFPQEKLSGDLTRLGYYLEKEFGWNNEELYFKPPLANKGELNFSYDIIVIGDSFSLHSPTAQTLKGSYWTNFLAKETGLKVGVFGMSDPSPIDLIKHYSSQANPPSLIIYESIERKLINGLGNKVECPRTVQLSKKTPVVFQPLSVKPLQYKRNTIRTAFDYGYGVKYLFSMLTGHNFNTNVVKKKLVKGKFFSNMANNNILLYGNDFSKKTWTNQDWKNIKCNLLHLQNEAQKNNKTKFISLIAPDKTTIYSSFFESKTPKISRLNLLENSRLNFLRLDELLINKVQTGTVDLYLPNDTHWSSKGHSIVATEVIRYISKN